MNKKVKLKYLFKMSRTQKSKVIKCSLLFISLIFFGCCKVGYTVITISNLSGKDKYYKASAIIRNTNHTIGWNDLNELKVNKKSEVILNDIYSEELNEFGKEKRIIIIYFDLKKDKKGKDVKIVKDSIIKNYSMKELENNNWEITFSEN